MCELVPPSLPPHPRQPLAVHPSSGGVSSAPVSSPSTIPGGIMCSSGQPAGALVSAAAAAYHGLKVPPSPASPFVFHPSMTQAAFDFHRAQLYDYNARLHFGLRAAGYGPGGGTLTPYAPHGPHDPLAHYYQAKYDPRARFVHEEPKPSHSYIGLIAMAILASKEMKLVLADIYQWILDNYVYFRNRGPGWRNSIRHNLSLNDCFIKAGRSANGKGHYWAVHPANVEDFKKGDFRRRKAQRKVRRHMGLSVPDDEDSPSPPPPASTDSSDWATKVLGRDHEGLQTTTPQQQASRPDSVTSGGSGDVTSPTGCTPSHGVGVIRADTSPRVPASGCGKKRLFDVESLLAPETTTADFRRSGYDLNGHLSKVQKTAATIVITPDHGGSPRPTDLLDLHDDPDDENIDVEDVGNADDDVIAMNTKLEERGGESGGERSPQRAASASPPRGPGAFIPCPAPRRVDEHHTSNPSSRPASRPDSRPDSCHSPPSPRTSPGGPSSCSPSVSDTIRTAGALALHQAAHNHHHHHHHQHHHPGRGPWGATAGLVGGPGGWRDGHPSAFHSTVAAAGGGPAPAVASLSAWSGVAPHAFPLMSAAFPAPAGSSPAEALAAQQRWQETFSRMMARPIDHSKSNVKTEA